MEISPSPSPEAAPVARPIVTTDVIIGYLQDRVEQKLPIAPSAWVEAATKLNVLLGDETDKLLDLQQKVADLKITYLTGDEKRVVSKAKMFVEATDIYKDMKRQEAKIDRIIEFIRLAKVQARMRDSEWNG